MQAVPKIKWGKHTRVILDVGCGVASFGGYMFERDVLTMSFAPKDEHEAQVQFALERGIPAISAVMGSQRLPFPSRVFDLIHCARCRVPLLKKIRCLFRWQATLGIESPSPAWRLFCLVSNSSCYFASYVCIDGIYVLGACDYQER